MTHVYDWGMTGPSILSVRCPHCGGMARFEADVSYDVSGHPSRSENGRLSCLSCAYARAHRLAWPEDAYYRVEVEGVELWAWTRAHVCAIRDFVASDVRDVSAYPGFKLSLLHLPAPLLRKSARERVVRRLTELLEVRWASV